MRASATTIRPGSYIPGAPDRVASAGVTLEGGGGWFGALRWRYFGPRPLIEDNSVRSKATSLVNARAGYAFSKTLKLQLDVFNLFNRKDNDIDYFYESRLRASRRPSPTSTSTRSRSGRCGRRWSFATEILRY